MAKKTIFATRPSRSKAARSSGFQKPTNKGRSYVNFDHKKAHDRLLAAGDWCESVMLTLTSRPNDPHWQASYFHSDVWIETLRMYYKETKTIVRYHIVANNGKSGNEQASAHVMFEEPLPDFDLLMRIFEANRFGIAKLTDAGGEVSKYIAKNLCEPDAEERSSKWRPENSD
jgi:hypothetical protein